MQVTIKDLQRDLFHAVKHESYVISNLKCTDEERLKATEEKEQCLAAIKAFLKSPKTVEGAEGVTLDKRRCKYRARITKNGKRISLGSYDTLREAKQACDLALSDRTIVQKDINVNVSSFLDIVSALIVLYTDPSIRVEKVSVITSHI